MISIISKSGDSYEEFKFLSGWYMGPSSPLPEGWQKGAFIPGNTIGKPNNYIFITTATFTFICEYQKIASDSCWEESDLEYLKLAVPRLENMSDEDDDY